jgi:hypothetical protein
MYFKKIKDHFEYNQYELKDIVAFYYENNMGLTYYSIDNNNSHLFYCIKEPYRKYFNINVLNINTPYVPPHTDSNIKVSINFYIQTNNCKTSFYKFKNSNYTVKKLDNQTNGGIFDLEDLNEVDSFIAKDNEAYVLDVTHPHSVTNLSNTNNNRIAICIQSTVLSFNETLEVLI